MLLLRTKRLPIRVLWCDRVLDMDLSVACIPEDCGLGVIWTLERDVRNLSQACAE